MPVHDWTRVSAGDFHHFHQNWITKLADAFNTGGLPPGYTAMAAQVTGGPVPDVVALQTRRGTWPPSGAVVATAPPTARQVLRYERVNYAKRKDRVVIRFGRGRVLAIIELVSPGNKDGQHAIRSFVDKAYSILAQGVNLLVVDLFPPTPRDPVGIHKLIADELGDEPFEFLPDKPLTVASYVGGSLPQAYVDTVGVGDPLPDAPLFLTDEHYVRCPLEATYQQAWAVLPADIRDDLTGTPPEGD